MIIHKIDQRSDEWHQLRLGKWTASAFDKAITGTGKESASAKTVNNRLVAEMLLGEPDSTFSSEAMERGKELEQEAFDYLNLVLGSEFEAVGFIDSGLGYGCSPDGLDKKNKIGLELKCPLAHTHIEYLAANELPAKYFAQVQGSMLVTGFDSWLFFSYHPDLPPFITRVKRDNAFCDKLKVILEKNCEEVRANYERIKNLSN